jgi:hypothetical protein
MESGATNGEVDLARQQPLYITLIELAIALVSIYVLTLTQEQYIQWRILLRNILQ